MDKLKSFFKEIWLFISSGLFLSNFAKMAGLAVVLFLLLNWWLGCFTNHGESVQVDDFTGIHLSDAQRKGTNKGFRFEVIDSAWVEGKPSGLIINQIPKPLSRVKEGRRIYVTVTGEPKMVLLPQLSESSYNFNEYSRRIRLRHGITSTIKERIFSREAENSIKYLLHDSKKITENDIKKGYKIQEGSSLQFVITERRTSQMNIPNLVCLEFDEADFLASTHNLNIGQIFEDASVIERDKAYVYKQEPAFSKGSFIRMGSQINIWLTQDLPRDCE